MNRLRNVPINFEVKIEIFSDPLCNCMPKFVDLNYYESSLTMTMVEKYKNK